MALVIDKFYINKINVAPQANILIIGTSNHTRSLLIKNILYFNQDHVIGNIFTSSNSHDYDDICPPKHIHNYYNKYVVMEMNDSSGNDSSGNDNGKPSINIFDNCFSPKNMHCFVVSDNIDLSANTPELKEFFTKKHNTINITSHSFPYQFTDEFLNNMDYIFILHENTLSMRQRIYNNYIDKKINYIDSFEKFTELFNNLNCLVISNNPPQLFYHDVPKQIPDFSMNNHPRIEIDTNKMNDSDSDTYDFSFIDMEDQLRVSIKEKEEQYKTYNANSKYIDLYTQENKILGQEIKQINDPKQKLAIVKTITENNIKLIDLKEYNNKIIIEKLLEETVFMKIQLLELEIKNIKKKIAKRSKIGALELKQYNDLYIKEIKLLEYYILFNKLSCENIYGLKCELVDKYNNINSLYDKINRTLDLCNSKEYIDNIYRLIEHKKLLLIENEINYYEANHKQDIVENELQQLL
jgi:hypothetical protein